MRLLVLSLVSLSLMAGQAIAELRIDITRGQVEPMPVAVTDFSGSSESRRTRASLVATETIST